jgi:hypothetical protein
VIGIGQNSPLGQAHVVAAAAPVVVPHEAFKRREAADAQHQQVASFAGAHAHLGQAGGAADFRLQGTAVVEQQGAQRAAAMRGHQGTGRDLCLCRSHLCSSRLGGAGRTPKEPLADRGQC